VKHINLANSLILITTLTVKSLLPSLYQRAEYSPSLPKRGKGRFSNKCLFNSDDKKSHCEGTEAISPFPKRLPRTLWVLAMTRKASVCHCHRLIWVLLILSIIFLFSILPASNLFPATAIAEEKSIFNGRVMDTEEKPVEGAEIFIYDSPDVKRPADFISARTDKEGRFQIVLPIGKYWAVARLRSGERYGPLLPGDKHSGEPVEIELAPDKEIKKDFIVADIREAVRTKQKIREDYIKIKGRILNKNGFPVKMVYAIADKNKVITEIPDYISAWTDNDGNYTLYLPRGKYYIGYATVFPPGQKYTLNKEVVFETDKSEINIITNSE
jgi:hypothetical protein